MRKWNSEGGNTIYVNLNIQDSINGLCIIRAGETYPNPKYFIERTKTSRLQWGGIYVIEYVKSGKGYIECDGVKHTVSEGDLYILNRFHHHMYYSDKDNPLSKIWINVTGDFMHGLFDALKIKEGVIVAHMNAKRYIEEIHKQLKKLTYQTRHMTYDSIALILTELLLRVNRNRRTTATDALPVFEIKNYIDSGINPRMSLDEICKQFYANKSYIIALFGKTFGITPYQYILQKKMETARDLLTFGSFGIGEISEMLGYTYPQAFSAAFKKIYGCNPSEYKKS